MKIGWSVVMHDVCKKEWVTNPKYFTSLDDAKEFAEKAKKLFEQVYIHEIKIEDEDN